MNLLAPAALGLAALALPLIALYMLRSRRRRVVVPSVFLWRRAETSVTAAAPWQRLELNPLLIIQLIILGVLVFALSRPFFAQASLLGPHTVMVIDTSGSMAAADRFDAAIARATSLTADVSAANLVSIVEAGPRARVVGSFLRTDAAVQSALSEMSVTGGRADLDGAIRLGRGLATPDRPTNLVILSDGSSDSLATEPVVGADHIRFSDTADNVAISGFSVEPSGEGVVRLFLNVSNHTGTAEDVDVALTVDGIPAGSVTLEVPALSDASQTVPIEAGPGNTIVAARTGRDDGLDLDDVAYVVVEGGADAAVGVLGRGSTFIDVLVDIAPGFLRAAPDAADILIVDGGPLPEIDRPTWLIRPETPPEGVDFTELVTNVGATYQAPGEPILDSVDLSGLAVSEAQVAETFSWLPIVRAGDVPLILLGEVNGYRVVYFTFDITHSNLPVQVGFPILGARILDWLGGVGTASAQSAVAGTPIDFAAPAGSVTEVLRNGASIARLDGQSVSFAATGMPGVYDIRFIADDGTTTSGPRAVRSFDRTESVAGSRDISVIPPTRQTAESGALLREWAPLLVAIAAALLLVEWWMAHRRRSQRSEVVA